MTQSLLLCHIFLLFIETNNIIGNDSLRTEQGIIYGRLTQQSIEYLG